MKPFTTKCLTGLVCAIALLAMGASQMRAATATVPTGPGSLSGIWVNADYKGTGQYSERQRAIHTADGKPPPLLPGPAKLLEQRFKDADEGKIFANTLADCLPGGVPEMDFGAAYPVQILETPGQVTMLYEEQNHFRIIRLNAKHQVDPDPSFMGDSVGHWDGDTLVVDTIGLNDQTTLDMVGTPHSDALHVIERFRRIALNKLQIDVTIDDKKTFSRPWHTKVTYRAAGPDTQMAEYICENNHNGADKNGFQSFGGSGTN